ncbi:HNH endonuclease [Egicoccus sp. AB-alg2]|uniref:HNH endonuclease n=1 Tax=Egicoccus sp. AB-alg2 TaxID=3242693 RepID=UPI00359D2403
MPKRRWTDAQLRDALATSATWSDVCRALGLTHRGGTTAMLRRRCAELGLEYAHLEASPGRRRWTDAQLDEAVTASTNLRQVFTALELTVGGSSWLAMQDHIRRLALDTSHWDRPVPAQRALRPSFQWSDEQVLAAARGARSVAQVMGRLGLDPKRKRGRAAVERRLRDVGVDPDGFRGQAWARGEVVASSRGRPLAELLVVGAPALNTTWLKQRLVREGLLAWRCARCGLERWLGRPIALQLDHVNGDRCDNRLENLRLLCPNCHSQTGTFAGRNVGNGYSPPRS